MACNAEADVKHIAVLHSVHADGWGQAARDDQSLARVAHFDHIREDYYQCHSGDSHRPHWETVETS